MDARVKPAHDESLGFSPPHPVAAVVFLPAGEPAIAELQEQTVVVVDQAAAAQITQREIDFAAGSAADILQGLAQCGRDLRHIHAEHQWRVVRQISGEGATPVERRALRTDLAAPCACDAREQPCEGGSASHAATALGRPSRNGTTASMKACG